MAFSSGELWRNRIHRVVIHLCSPLLCQKSWLQRQLLKDGIILLTIFVGIVSVQHQVLTISLSHGIVTRTELVYRMLVTLLYVSKQWGYCSDNQGFSARMITFPLGFSNACYSLIASTKNESTNLAYNSGNGIVLSKTQAKIVFDGEGGYWFAVGR